MHFARDGAAPFVLGVGALLALGTGALVALTGCQSEAQVGDPERPFTMYFVPSVDAEGIALSADKITADLETRMAQKIGRPFHIESAVPANYIAVVEAFGTDKADFAALNTFSYILAHDEKKYPVEAILSVVRGENEHTYRGEIVTHVDSGITKLEDLAGKKFAFTDPASTAGFIMPAKLLKDRGIQLGEQVFGQKHDIVVTMVYQRQVDAGACYYSPPRFEIANGDTLEVVRDARAKVMTQFPDVTEKVKILAFTDEIPNDPWVVRTNLYADPAEQKRVVDALVSSLLEYAQTAEGKTALDQLYSISGLARANDATYAPLRQALGEAGLDLQKILSQ